MSYLLDTSVLWELARRRPDRSVLRWLEGAAEESLHLSVLTLGELSRVAEGLKSAGRRESVRGWLERDLRERFGDRLLPVDAAVAESWGRLLARVERPVPAVDGLLAATALTHGLRIVTRNARGFRFPGLEVVNPWDRGV
jgi:predicted nucleic acid-binding protein